jgi:hypothetical protein
VLGELEGSGAKQRGELDGGYSAAAAGARAPASKQPDLDHTLLGELQGFLVEVGAVQVGGDDGRKVVLAVGATGSRWWTELAAGKRVRARGELVASYSGRR